VVRVPDATTARMTYAPAAAFARYARELTRAAFVRRLYIRCTYLRARVCVCVCVIRARLYRHARRMVQEEKIENGAGRERGRR